MCRNQFECPVCQRQFSQHNHLINHLQVHATTASANSNAVSATRLRLFQCPRCPQQFAQMASLQMHAQLHAIQDLAASSMELAVTGTCSGSASSPLPPDLDSITGTLNRIPVRRPGSTIVDSFRLPRSVNGLIWISCTGTSFGSVGSLHFIASGYRVTLLF
jgi:C2H2-type zinc finger